MVYVLFLQVHYKESQLYLTRFKQYLSRALALVKQHVVNTLRAATASILPKPVNLCKYTSSVCHKGFFFGPFCAYVQYASKKPSRFRSVERAFFKNERKTNGYQTDFER